MVEYSCPFCGASAAEEYIILSHLESSHPEVEDPDLQDTSDATSKWTQNERLPEMLADQIAMDYVECPIDGCGEAIMATELDSHLDMHENADECSEDDDAKHGAETSKYFDLDGSDEQSSSRSLSRPGVHPSEEVRPVYPSYRQQGGPSPRSSFEIRQERTKAAWKTVLKMPKAIKSAKSPASNGSSGSSPKRLGKAELGPHANEVQMPSWLRHLLEEKDGEVKRVKRLDHRGRTRIVECSPNQLDGILPVIDQLVQQDREVEYAYLCHPSVLHISKIFREGGFCGYRNIQMLCSFIVATKSQGYPHFNGKVPSIFQIQDWIENAWDLGINAAGRVETGGIRGTRKYIGTPEAQAMFTSLDIASSAEGVKSKDGRRADEMLCRAVEKYFEDGYPRSKDKVCKTNLPPLYFQHAGHSMTIVGLERRKDGSRNLLVFDPMFGDSSHVRKAIGQSFKHSHPDDHLKAYRRGAKYLSKYKEFEILKLTPPKA